MSRKHFQEIKDRCEFFYKQIDGTFKWPNSQEGDILKLTYKLIKKYEGEFYSVGGAIENAARYLPEGYEILIRIERGAGTMELVSPDVDSKPIDFYNDSIAGTVKDAIEKAIKKY